MASIREWLPGPFAHIRHAQGRPERVPDYSAFSDRDVEGFGKHRTPILPEDSNRINDVIDYVVNVDLRWNLWVAVQDNLGV